MLIASRTYPRTALRYAQRYLAQRAEHPSTTSLSAIERPQRRKGVQADWYVEITVFIYGLTVGLSPEALSLLVLALSEAIIRHAVQQQAAGSQEKRRIKSSFVLTEELVEQAIRALGLGQLREAASLFDRNPLPFLRLPFDETSLGRKARDRLGRTQPTLRRRVACRTAAKTAMTCRHILSVLLITIVILRKQKE